MSDTDTIATLAAARRSWAVASIHGDAERLSALHAKLLDSFAAGENLVYLGNYLGRGEAVADTVQELLLCRRSLLARPGVECEDIVYLRGSQEEMWHKLLQIQFATNPREVLAWMLNHGVGATLAAYGGDPEEGLEAADKGAVAMTAWTDRLREAMRAVDGHVALMSALRRAAYTADRTLLFVHAGIDAARPLSEQTDAFWWGAPGFDAIEAPYQGFRRVIRGFDSRHRGIEVGEATATVDGGCGFGGPLLAACFDAAGEHVDTIEA